MGLADLIIIAAIVYVILGLAIGLLIKMRSGKKNKASPSQKAKKPATALKVDHSTTANGNYQMNVPYLKQGGMATIWLALERRTGRTCVIKTPRHGTSLDNVYLDKLMLEAQILKKLNHPGIVKYYDDFYYKNEFHLVIEYLNGVTLLESSPRTPWTEPRVVDMACQLLDVLAYLHGSGITHRDINPKNIMLCSDGTATLIDFGTAKNLQDVTMDKSRRDPFTQIANRGFDIPELFIGGESDQRCDLCGLAQTCIYLLTLNQPNEICLGLFKSSWPRSYEEARSLVDYLAARGISQRTAKCLAQAVFFAPDRRFANARAMRAALSSVEGFQISQMEAVIRK
jgi:serine/threonine protein kinase